jgi:phosphoribosyl-ATP pyrophosphohydrolase/phosphoribosyl-AMP cyclohydrolase
VLPPKDAILPVVVQDIRTGAVLMLAWTNAEAIAATRSTGRAHFWSRSRRELWDKGATSGQVLHVRNVAWDCDGDALLYQVEAPQGACHTGRFSCFGDVDVPTAMLARLYDVQSARIEGGAEESYTRRLAAAGPDRVLRKVGEETAEFIIACKNNQPDEVRYEAADVVYHLWLALHLAGVSLEDLALELRRRRGGPIHGDADPPGEVSRQATDER